MAVGQSRGNGGKRRRTKRHQVMSEINVTPFVDVMLVLLIIFMVTAPLLTVGVEIDLPESEASQLDVKPNPIVIGIQADGSVFLGSTGVTIDDMTAKISAIAEARRGLDTVIEIKASEESSYGLVSKVIGKLDAAGYRQFTLVHERQF